MMGGNMLKRIARLWRLDRQLKALAGGAKRAAPVVIYAAQGSYGFGLTGQGTTRVFSLGNYNLLHRRELEASPTIAVCTAVIGRMFRSLELELRRDDKPVDKHPLLDLFNDAPNELFSASEFWDQVARELVLGGECIIRVHRDGRGRPYRLMVWPYDETNIDPPSRIVADPDCLCTYRYRDAIVEYVPGKPPPVCHVRMSIDHDRPMRALDPWRGLHAEVLSSTFAALWRSEYFRQGGSPRLVAQMEAPKEGAVGNPGEEAMDRAQEMMDAVFESVKAGLTTWQGGKAHRMPAGIELTDYGPKSTADPMLTMPSRAVDEKLLAAAGLPSISINNMEKSTYANSRQQQAVLVRDAIQPRISAFLSAIKRDLLKPMGGRNLELAVNTDVLVEDEKAVYNAIILDRYNAGVITANEARVALGYDEDPAFDEPKDDGMMDRDDEGDDDEESEEEKDADDKTEGGAEEDD